MTSKSRNTIIVVVFVVILWVGLGVATYLNHVNGQNTEASAIQQLVDELTVEDQVYACMTHGHPPDAKAVWWNAIARQCFYVYVMDEVQAGEHYLGRLPVYVAVVPDSHPAYNPEGMTRSENGRGYVLRWHSKRLVEYVPVR